MRSIAQLREGKGIGDSQERNEGPHIRESHDATMASTEAIRQTVPVKWPTNASVAKVRKEGTEMAVRGCEENLRGRKTM